MMRRSPVILTGVIVILFLLAGPAQAQPALPDIAGISAKGTNLLRWTCQYEGIKKIEVLRSADSVNYFAPIGTVKKVDKGPQEFTDLHPLPGNNWYELRIEFKSSLKWVSKTLNLFVDTTGLAAMKEVKMPPAVMEPISTPISKPPKIEVISDTASRKPETVVVPIPSKPAVAKDTTNRKKPRPSIQLRPDTTVSDAATYFKSRYVNVDAGTGHIFMDLPDVKKFHYIIKFYDQKDKMIVEVPKLNASPVILDKRNFQKKGIYHFIIKKDSKFFDQGYIIIN